MNPDEETNRAGAPPPSGEGQRRLSREGKRVIIICVLWIVASVVFRSRVTLFSLLLFPFAVAYFAALFSSIGCALGKQRQDGWRRWAPFAVWAATFLAAPAAARGVDRVLFLWSFPTYEAIVQGLEDGRIPLENNEVTFLSPAEYGVRFTLGVHAAKDAQGNLAVEFLTDSGGVFLHMGYFYQSPEFAPLDHSPKERWPHIKEVKENWYFFAD